MSFLNERQRREVYKSLVTTTNRKFVDPRMNGVDWLRIAKETEDGIVRSATSEDFERLTNELLQRLRTSHIGFFQGDRPKSPGRNRDAARTLWPVPMEEANMACPKSL